VSAETGLKLRIQTESAFAAKSVQLADFLDTTEGKKKRARGDSNTRSADS